MLNSKDKFQLYKGDCLEIMKDIPDGSIDLTITDPPLWYRFNASKRKGKI